MKRHGFTLIELLVAISIIAFLAGLVAYASMAVVGQSRRSATNSIILQIDRALIAKVGGIQRYIEECDARAGQPPRGRTLWVNVPQYIPDGPVRIEFEARLPQNRQDGSQEARLHYLAALGRKQFLRQELPQSFVEAGITPPVGHDPETESAELMYKFLVEDPWRGAGKVDLSSLAISDTDGDGMLELVDAWRRPLRFYRWPTRLFRSQPAGSETTPTSDITVATIDRQSIPLTYLAIGVSASDSMLAQDQDDLIGLVIGGVLSNDVHTGNIAEFERRYHTPETFHKFLVISAGPDGIIGLYEPVDVPNYGRLAQPNWSQISAIEDDLSNLNPRIK